MKKLSNKYTVYIFLGIMTLIIAVSGTSYAYFSRKSIQEEENIISTMSCVEVELISESQSIKMDATYPMTETEGMATRPFDFTLANKCDNYTEYYLVASVVNGPNNIPLDYVKIALNGDAIIPPIRLNHLPIEDTPNELSNFNIVQTFQLASGAFNQKEKTSYSFRMWLDADNTAVWHDETISGKTLAVKLTIIGVARKKPTTSTTTTTILTTTTVPVETQENY